MTEKELKDKLAHYKELLNNVVNHVAVAENISTQIEKLHNDFDFTRDDLIDFGYSGDDIDSILSEEDENED